MQATRIIANLSVPDIGEARDFYVDYLGLSVEAIQHGLGRQVPVPGRPAPSFNSSPATQPLHRTR